MRAYIQIQPPKPEENILHKNVKKAYEQYNKRTEAGNDDLMDEYTVL